MSQILFINSRFRIGKVMWIGPVLASPEALYFVQVRPLSGAAEVGAMFGVIGALVGAAVDAVGSSSPTTTPGTCRLSDLPADVRDQITGHSEWPRRATDPRVLIVPKSAAGVIRHPRFSNEIRFEAGGEKFLFGYRLFAGKRVRRLFADAGWALDW